MINKKHLLGMLLAFPLCSQANSINFTKTPNGNGYILRGFVTPDMLTLRNSTTWSRFYAFIHTTGDIYYNVEDDQFYCPKSKEGAASFFNDRLKRGVVMTQRAYFSDDGRYWRADLHCMTSDRQTWVTNTFVPSPEGSAICDINYPSTVSFGNVSVGEKKELLSNINIACDGPANVNVRMTKDIIDLGDAKISYSLPGGGKTYTTAVTEKSPGNFDMRFTLDDTGQTLGHKTGNAILIFEWQ